MIRVLFALVALVALAICSLAVAGDIHKYEQPVDPKGYIYDSTNASLQWNTADDFVGTVTGTVTGLDWYGGYYWTEGPMAITGFNVRFYSDDQINGSARPGTLLQDTVYAGNANETDTGLVGGDGYKIWKYSISTAPFQQQAGEKYWISISAIPGWDTELVDTVWGWRNTKTTTGYGAVQASWGDPQSMWGNAFPAGSDMAFSVTAVPEPATAASMAALLLPFACLVRRRRSSTS